MSQCVRIRDVCVCVCRDFPPRIVVDCFAGKRDHDGGRRSDFGRGGERSFTIMNLFHAKNIHRVHLIVYFRILTDRPGGRCERMWNMDGKLCHQTLTLNYIFKIEHIQHRIYRKQQARIQNTNSQSTRAFSMMCKPRTAHHYLGRLSQAKQFAAPTMYSWPRSSGCARACLIRASLDGDPKATSMPDDAYMRILCALQSSYNEYMDLLVAVECEPQEQAREEF